MNDIRQPPYNLDAEQNVLGALLMDNRVFDEVADVISANDFFQRAHKKIFSAIIAMANTNQPFDAVTLSEWMERTGEINEVGGLSYLGTLAKNTASVVNAKAYALVVKNYSIERRLIQAGNDIVTKAYGCGNTQEKLDHAQAALMAVIDGTVSQCEMEMPSDVLNRVINKIEFAFNNGDDIIGLRTGFIDLDTMTAGLHPGDLVIVAGRPSMGKTTLACNIARHAALNGDGVLLVSLEMPSDQIMMREVAALSGIEHSRLRSGKLTDDEWPKLTRATSQLSMAKLIMDSSPSMGLLELKARARREKRKHDIKLIVIDYLQLMKTDHMQNRTQEIGALSRGLKQLARELNIPVVVLSQLNRSLENRTNKRPIMSDLRESGDIEQDADLILFVHRDEVYNEDSDWQGIAEIIIGKQRNGPQCTVPLTYNGGLFRFGNYTGELPERARKKLTGMPRLSGNANADRSANER